MRNKKIKPGFTLVELLVVISTILLLAVIGLPAAKKLLSSFESSLSVRHVISAALGNARAIAAREQAYAGLRFQQDLEGNQYMVFIINDPASPPLDAELANDPTLTGTGLANGFRAVTGYKPMKLPVNVGVLDYVADDLEIDEELELTNRTTFSITFSPAGKLVTHDVRIRNRHGQRDSSANILGISTDEIFNKKDKVDTGEAMFYQDDYIGDGSNSHGDLGLGQEQSRNSFIIYDKSTLEGADDSSRWTDYLQYLEVVYVSPYTGRIINK
ncbi:MAG: type II secretion system protein [Planctomycetota bacterium]|jgi:prepilin-type N-terminal cleavage/methylation domain-containing protein